MNLNLAIGIGCFLAAFMPNNPRWLRITNLILSAFNLAIGFTQIN